MDKIKKCFNLAKSSNANEAANALAMAKKLMQKYGLTNEDIEFIEMGETTSKSRIQNNPVAYVSVLVTEIAKSFQVIPILVSETYVGSYPQFIGRKDAAMMAAYAFDVIYRQLLQARKQHLSTLNPRLLKKNKTIRADRFCEGWVVAVVENLKAEKLPEEENTRIRSYMAHRNDVTSGTAKVSRRKGGSPVDHLLGAHAGGKVHVNTPMTGTEQNKITHVL